MIVLLFLLSGVLGLIFSVYQHEKPMVNNVRETFHSPATFVKQLENDKHAGEKIFKEFCSVCHDKHPKIDIRAPRISDKKTWQGLKKVGIPILLKMTIEGTGAMPARGGCFECSDAQLRETIEYMLR